MRLATVEARTARSIRVCVLTPVMMLRTADQKQKRRHCFKPKGRKYLIDFKIIRVILFSRVCLIAGMPIGVVLENAVHDLLERLAVRASEEPVRCLLQSAAA